MSFRLAHVLGNSAFGGDTVYIYSLIEMAMQRGLEAELIAGDPEVLDQARTRGFRCVHFTEIVRPIRPWKDVVAIARLARLLRQRGYHIVHSHTSKGGVVGRMAAWRAKVPIILHTVQGFGFHEFSGRLATAVYANVERFMATRCHRIISVNRYDRDWAIRLGIVRDPKQIVTVYNGVSPERLAAVGSPDRSTMLKDIGVEGEASVLVNLARLAPQKAQRYLLAAMPKILAHAKQPVHLLLVGSGEDEGMLRTLTRRLGIEQHVHFLGFRRDGLAWLKIADISVLSSLWEGHSVTILEAMGMGTPVVATDIKGNRETLDHDRNGLLVRPKDPDSLADAILRYLHDPEQARRHGQAGQDKFFKMYTEQHVQDNTWSVYRELIEERNLLDRLG